MAKSSPYTKSKRGKLTNLELDQSNFRDLVNRPRMMVLDTFGSTRAASTKPTLLSLARLSTRCSDGTRRLIDVMPIC
jgi:hypothetical protein